MTVGRFVDRFLLTVHKCQFASLFNHQIKLELEILYNTKPLISNLLKFAVEKNHLVSLCFYAEMLCKYMYVCSCNVRHCSYCAHVWLAKELGLVMVVIIIAKEVMFLPLLVCLSV